MHLSQIMQEVVDVNENNVGDVYVKVARLHSEISDPDEKAFAELIISSKVRSVARDADIGLRIFSEAPVNLRNLSLTSEHQLMLMTLISNLKIFCYGCERLNEAAEQTRPDSSPVRFYLNSIYHLISSFYLLDKKDMDLLGGMVYKSLHKTGLDKLLSPIIRLIEAPLGGTTFGEVIRRIRNRTLVHGTFNPYEIQPTIELGELRNPENVIQLNDYIWDLFNQTFILELKLISILTYANVDINKLLDEVKQNLDLD